MYKKIAKNTIENTMPKFLLVGSLEFIRNYNIIPIFKLILNVLFIYLQINYIKDF